MPVCSREDHIWTEVSNGRGRSLVVEGHAVYLCARCGILRHAYRLICQSSDHTWTTTIHPVDRARQLLMGDDFMILSCLRCDTHRMVVAS